jgi:uncharacterized protein YbjT (DUF2867 family)
MILVVGATGQLGTAIVRKLIAAKQQVRTFVRDSSNCLHLDLLNAELWFGDLCDAENVEVACEGVETVIATANALLPRNGDCFEKVEGEGYHNLIAACRRAGVSQFIFVSMPVTPLDEEICTFHFKRQIEKQLQASGLSYTIVRASPFMDDWLALIGSTIPLRGAVVHTLRRPFWFSRLYMNLFGHLVENLGLALIPGNGQARHAFVTVDDVATFMVRCIGNPDAQDKIFHLGGPEILTWDDAVKIFGQVLGKPIHPLHASAGILRTSRSVLGLLSEGAGNFMGLDWAVGICETPYDSKETEPFFDLPRTTVEQFLRRKASLPAAA